MENSNNSKLILLGILAICTIAVGFYVLKPSFSDRSQVLAEESVSSEESAGNANNSLSVVELLDNSAAETYELSAGEKSISPETADAYRERLIKKISANLENDGINKLIADQQLILISNKYEDLVSKFKLNDDEAVHFVELLTMRQMVQVEMGMKLMAGVLSEEEKREMARGVDNEMGQLNTDICDFLNNTTDCEYFRFFEKTEQERSSVNAFRAILDNQGIPIGREEGDFLVDLLHKEIQAHSFGTEIEEGQQSDISQYNTENIDQFIREIESSKSVIIQEASQVLSTDQLMLFEVEFHNYVKSHEQQLRMAQQLLNPEG